MSKRLFIAIRPSKDVLNSINKFQDDLKSVALSRYPLGKTGIDASHFAFLRRCRRITNP